MTTPIPVTVRHAHCFQDNLSDNKKTLCLEIDVWEDGSGKARVNDVELTEFCHMADKSGRKKICRMLRQAADLIEEGRV